MPRLPKTNTNTNYNDKAFVYIRVSTQGQANEVSLDLQKSLCKSFATDNNLFVSKVFSEVGSAYKAKQPELTKLVNLIRPGMTLIVYAMDRFSRNLQFAKHIMDTLVNKGCRVLSVQKEHDLLFAVAQAEHEAKAIGRRISDRSKLIRRAGGYIGGRPTFGYKAIKVPMPKTQVMMRKKVVDEAEQEVIQLIKLCRTVGTPASEVLSQIQLVKGPDFDLDELDIDDEVLADHPCSFKEIAYFFNHALRLRCRDNLWTPKKVEQALDNDATDTITKHLKSCKL